MPIAHHKKILVTGGTGYVGSHATVELLAAGYDVFVIDNLSNSSATVLDRIEDIAKRRPGFEVMDVRDRQALRRLFTSQHFDAVIHFAGLKAVGESVNIPLAYYDTNVTGSLTLLESMVDHGIKTLVFSSSATVYGEPRSLPIREDFPLSASNPYGQTKLVVEQMLRDFAKADPAFKVALLRYFNPVGAHPSGRIGEAPSGVPNNLMPYIAQVAIGKLKELPIYGNDYPTPDGTGVRDYIHVVDLARGHVAALSGLVDHPGVLTVNLGTGRGYSVLEMVRAFSAATGRRIPYRFESRRPGDIAQCYADATLARSSLDWAAKLDINAMCTDTWRWQQWASENL